MNKRIANSNGIERIDSQKHPIIQILRDIQTEKGRDEHGAFHVEGSMVVRRALEYGGRALFILVTDKFASSTESKDIIEAAKAAGVDVFEVTEGLLTKILPAKPSPGVIACVERRLYEPANLLEGENSLLILIDRCENPDNLGMLLRSLDAAGVDGVAITSDSVDPFSRLSVRASRGSVLSLKLSIVSNPEEWLVAAQQKGFKVSASSTHGAVNVWTVDLKGPTIIVVGNEHTGVRQSIRDLADSFVFIPMAGKMESLNIAVAGAILAYEAVRQRWEVMSDE
ncbi:MAG: RNA methyltransferase [Armatimonadota bacterium]|nr:RNA methyltransferase [Armatimonadota bacterium]